MLISELNEVCANHVLVCQHANIEMGINGNHVYVTIIIYININMIIKQVMVG